MKTVIETLEKQAAEVRSKFPDLLQIEDHASRRRAYVKMADSISRINSAVGLLMQTQKIFENDKQTPKMEV